MRSPETRYPYPGSFVNWVGSRSNPTNPAWELPVVRSTTELPWMSCSRRSVSNPNVFWLALWEAMIRQIPTLRQIFDSSAHRLASLLLRSTAWHSSMMTAMPGRSGVGWNPRCEGSVAPMARFSVARASAMASRADSMSDHSSRQNALWSAIWEMKLDEAPPWPSAYHSTVWSLEARDRARVSSTTVLPEPVPPMTRPDHIESPPE